MKTLIVSAALAVAAAPVFAASAPREDLKALTAQLAKTPSDDALREKIIKLALKLKPAPAVPPEAKKHFVMAVTYQKEAKRPEDFQLAVNSYREALTLAPWWGDAYYNLSVSLESVKRFDEAKKALESYLLTRPKDAEQAQERLYALEAKKNLAAAAPAAPTGPDFSGAWVTDDGENFTIQRNGDGWLLFGPDKKSIPVVKVQGRLLLTENTGWGVATTHSEYLLSEDGSRMDVTRYDTQSSEEAMRFQAKFPGARMTELGVRKHYGLHRK